MANSSPSDANQQHQSPEAGPSNVVSDDVPGDPKNGGKLSKPDFFEILDPKISSFQTNFPFNNNIYAVIFCVHIYSNRRFNVYANLYTPHLPTLQIHTSHSFQTLLLVCTLRTCKWVHFDRLILRLFVIQLRFNSLD